MITVIQMDQGSIRREISINRLGLTYLLSIRILWFPCVWLGNYKLLQFKLPRSKRFQLQNEALFPI